MEEIWDCVHLEDRNRKSFSLDLWPLRFKMKAQNFCFSIFSFANMTSSFLTRLKMSECVSISPMTSWLTGRKNRKVSISHILYLAVGQKYAFLAYLIIGAVLPQLFCYSRIFFCEIGIIATRDKKTATEEESTLKCRRNCKLFHCLHSDCSFHPREAVSISNSMADKFLKSPTATRVNAVCLKINEIQCIMKGKTF